MIRKLPAVLGLLLLPVFAALTRGQTAGNSPSYESAPPEQAAQLLSPAQLDNLVAPVALYPDPLLSQVLAASTYPLEIVEAQQWLQANRNLRGAELVDAAKQQNWDASVQALVAFPDVLALLNRSVRWTTDLGNAFLAQQGDVMSAVQRMRAAAQNNGRLATTPQQTVTSEVQNGQAAIAIQPANPQVIYVPVYDPAYVWGPPAWGVYPSLWYPQASFGFGFGPGIFIGGLFSGLTGWGSWGWGLNWFTHSLFLNSFFFQHAGYHGFPGGWGGHPVWAHNPIHRIGVPYSNRMVANRFRGSSAVNWRSFHNGPGSASPGAQRYRSGASANYRAPAQGSHGFSNAGTQRTPPANRNAAMMTARSGAVASRYSAPRNSGQGVPRQGFAASRYSGRSYATPRVSTQRYSAPRSAQHYSAPRSSSHASAPHSSSHGSSHGSGGRHSSGGSRKH